jgi:hypothetical protein
MAEAAARRSDLFHDAERTAYATIPIGDHVETWPIRGTNFRHWMTQLLFEDNLVAKAPSSQAVHDAVLTCEAVAIYRGQERPVHLRVAPLDNGIVLDLGNGRWQAVHITPRGWVVTDEPSVRFIRSAGMQALPHPEHGGSIEALRPFLNLGSQDGWRLLVSWLVMAFRPLGPYPVLGLHGEQGAAKTTAGRILRSLVDPNRVPDRTVPRNERDLAISARNQWVTNLDNLSHMPDWLSDALARMSTGAGLSTRQLWTDTDEVLFFAQRPVLINGITEVITRGDLLDRAILIELLAVSPSSRRREAELWRAFEVARPLILGGLLDAVATALARESSVVMTSYPRMADFAQWIVAAEPALGWPEGGFLAAYLGNRSEAHELALDVSPVAAAVREFISGRKEWTGTATELLDILTNRVGDEVSGRRTWPTVPKVLSDDLRRLAPNLRAVGVLLEFTRGRRRLLHLSLEDQEHNAASRASTTTESSSPARTKVDAGVAEDPAAVRPLDADNADDADDALTQMESREVAAPICHCGRTKVRTPSGRFVCTYAPGHPTGGLASRDLEAAE